MGECRFEDVLYCKWPSTLRFLRMVEEGGRALDLTLSEREGRVRDHGFLWKVAQERVGDVYVGVEEEGLGV